MYNSGLYAWNTRAVRGVASSKKSTPCSSPFTHISDVSAGEMDNGVIFQVAVEKDVAETPINPVGEVLRGRCATFTSLDLRKSNSAEILLTFSGLMRWRIRLAPTHKSTKLS